MLIMVETVQRMKSFNPFYVHLAEKLISTDRSFLMCTQCAFWDKFKIMSDIKDGQIGNLSTYIAHLFKLQLIPVTMLKKIDFDDIDAKGVTFLRGMLREISQISTKTGTYSTYFTWSITRDSGLEKHPIRRIYFKFFFI